MLTVMNLYFIPIALNEISAKTVAIVLMIHMLNYMKKNTQIYFDDKSIYYFKISDVSSELHSLSSFHLYNIIHKNSYFCQGGYRDKLQ